MRIDVREASVHVRVALTGVRFQDCEANVKKPPNAVVRQTDRIIIFRANDGTEVRVRLTMSERVKLAAQLLS